MRLTLTKTLVAGSLLGWSVGHALAADIGYVPDRILLKAKNNVPDAAVRGMVAAQAAQQIDQIEQIGLRVLKVPPHALERVFNALARNPNTEFVDLDYAVAPEMTPDDPYFGSQWHHGKLGTSTAWDQALGSSQIVIAILDTGVDSSHPDLSSHIVPGWNTYDNNSNTSDVYGHGTRVAGAAAAIGNNTLGVAGVGFGCSIMPIRVSDSSGWGYASKISSGLVYAADHGARVANVSYRASTWSAVVSAAEYFRSKGGVVTVSAGNEGDFESSPDVASVLTVSASDSYDRIPSWSVRGNLIDFAAPGVGIYTTLAGGSYGAVSGTSFSAPVVAGVAGLVLSANPSLTPDQVEGILRQAADDLGEAGWDSLYGWGRINAQRAVDLALSVSSNPEPDPTPTPDTTAPSAKITAPAHGTIVSGEVTVGVSATDDVQVAGITVYCDGQLIASANTSSYSFKWNTPSISNGSHTLTAVAEDSSGNQGSASITVTVDNSVAQDTQAPTVKILSPRDGDRVHKMTHVDVAVSDNVEVVCVDLYVNGEFTERATSSPFTTRWQANKAARGSHELKCIAYDGTGNAAAASITVTK